MSTLPKHPLPQTASKTSNKKYSVLAYSPGNHLSFHDSPHLTPQHPHKTPTDTQQPHNHNQTRALRSPIEPLNYSRSTFYGPLAVTEVDHIMAEHRAEVDTLLLQINRLQNLLVEATQIKALELHKTRQECEANAFLTMSALRQNQNSQTELLEAQLRKLKQQLNDRDEAMKKMQLLMARERECSQSQKTKIKEQVRNLLQRKNAQLYELRLQGDKKVRDLQETRENQVSVVKYTCDKQMGALNKILQNKERELQKLKETVTKEDKYKQRLIQNLQRQKTQTQRRYEQRLDQQCQKYENLRFKLNKLVCQTSENQEKNMAEIQKIFKGEYAQLFELIKIKDGEVVQLRTQTESIITLLKKDLFAVQHQNQLLKSRMKDDARKNAQELDILKVKMSKLHENDVANVKQLYQLKLKHSLQSIGRLEKENRQLREEINLINAEHFQVKKRHEITVSEYKAKILKLKMGMTNIQIDFKERLQGEKSLMLMTSRSIIRQSENKNQNRGFLEEQLRKLRQLMELQNNQNENSQRALEEKITTAHNQLQMLSNRLVSIALDKKQLEGQLQSLREEKDAIIAQLKAELNKDKGPDFNAFDQIALKNQFREALEKKSDEIHQLKEKIAVLQSKIKDIGVENERYQMQNHIIVEEGKKQYEIISKGHLKEHTVFYEHKIKRLQDEKEELKKIIASQTQQITTLVTRYKQLEDNMRDTINVMKKRTVLQEKVMNLGLDVNLVKNLTQLLPKKDSL